MTITMRFVGLFAGAMVLAAPAPVQASSGPLGLEARNGRPLVRFDPASRETRVTGHVASGLCFSFRLPQEWRLDADGPETRLKAAVSEAGIDVNLRSAGALQHLPQRDLASRDAAFLQRDYEDLLGRPAQSVSLASSHAGAVRWSATWIDANLPTPSRTMTVEAFIIPLSKEWVLELSPENTGTLEAHNALVRHLLTGLTVHSGADCRG
jgi:hypothetical protein